MADHEAGSEPRPLDCTRVAEAAEELRQKQSEEGLTREALLEELNTPHLARHRTDMVLTGRIHNGKLELDQPTLDEIQRKFPEGDACFVALNSPFDAESLVP